MQHRLSPASAVLVAVATLGACATHGEAAPVADGPPRPRLDAAPAASGVGATEPQGVAPPIEVSDAQSAPAPVATAVTPAGSACAAGMVLVEGEYCTDVRENCVEWEDAPANPLARCAKFGPSECVGERVHKRFCIDRDEYVASGQTLPASDVSWTQASQVCASQGKRLCKETEWEFACGGEQMLPYPTGYDRDPKACNFDRAPLLDRKGQLLDLREIEDAGNACVSPFGVRNMSGNVDEWVYRDRTYGEWRSALKGGWWMAARNRCRPATTAHDEYFHGLQTGVRCCADAPDAH